MQSMEDFQISVLKWVGGKHVASPGEEGYWRDILHPHSYLKVTIVYAYKI